MFKEKTYRYFTEVLGQQGTFTVKHETLEDMQKYEEKLKEQTPYFVKQKSGQFQILEWTQVQGFLEMRSKGKTKYYLIRPIPNGNGKYALYVCLERVWSGLWGNYNLLPKATSQSRNIEKLKQIAQEQENKEGA